MTVMLDAALELAAAGWPVFPLHGKAPAIAKAIGGNGVLDATTDPEQITAWWTGRYRSCNIGGRVPAPLIVIDTDPRHGGHLTMAAHEIEHGPLPATLEVVSGRGDGGRHLYYRRPHGKLSAARLGAGIDLKTSAGYCVLPPSIHPESGQPYRWIERPPVAPPDWLISLLLPPIQTAPNDGEPWHTGPASPTTSPTRPAGRKSCNPTAGTASTQTATPTGHAGGTRPRPPRTPPRSGTTACSCTPQTPRSNPPKPTPPTATPGSALGQFSITTATSPQPRGTLGRPHDQHRAAHHQPTRETPMNTDSTTTITEDEFEAQVTDEPGHGGYRFTVPMRLHLDAGSKAEALELAMRWRHAIGCPELLGYNGRDHALAALDFDWHLHHPRGC